MMKIFDDMENKELNLKLYTDLLDSFPDAVIITGLDGNIQYWLAGSQKIFGYTRDEMIGKNIQILFGKTIDDLDVTDEFADGINFKNETGTELIVRTVSRLTYSINNAPVIIWIFRDITDFKKVENVMKSFYDEVHIELDKIVQEKTADLQKLNEELEDRVRQRTEELERMQRRLIEQAHQAGMAEMAISTLHNIGNILNSISTSNFIIKKNIDEHTLERLIKANNLFDKKLGTASEDIKQDYQILNQYYKTIQEKLRDEILNIQGMITRIDDKIVDINNIISDQNFYPDYENILEEADLPQFLDEIIDGEKLDHKNIEVIRNYNVIPLMEINKLKLKYVFHTLISTMAATISNKMVVNKRMVFDFLVKKRKIALKITAHDIGLDKEELDGIFAQGYTHENFKDCFRLHVCANYMLDLKGNIKARSEGKDKDLSFILYFNQ